MNSNIKGVGEEEFSMMGPGKMWLDRWGGGVEIRSGWHCRRQGREYSEEEEVIN